MSYFSTQGWVYIVISIISTIIALILNIYILKRKSNKQRINVFKSVKKKN